MDKEIHPIYLTESVYMPCFTKNRKERIEAIMQEMGPDVWALLYQARGWAFRWQEDSNNTISEEVMRGFIVRTDTALGLMPEEGDDQ